MLFGKNLVNYYYYLMLPIIMKPNVFLLVTDPNNACRDVIRSRDTDLRIKVYCLDKEAFEPDPDEIQFYGEYEGTPLAFETDNITAEDALDITEAIHWYAGYLGCPEMEILLDDPRDMDEQKINV